MAVFLRAVAGFLLAPLLGINGYLINRQHWRGLKDVNVILAFVGVLACPGALAIGLGIESSSRSTVAIGAAGVVVGLLAASIGYIRGGRPTALHGREVKPPLTKQSRRLLLIMQLALLTFATAQAELFLYGEQLMQLALLAAFIALAAWLIFSASTARE